MVDHCVFYSFLVIPALTETILVKGSTAEWLLASALSKINWVWISPSWMINHLSLLGTRLFLWTWDFQC